ncbi:MAG: amidohydrolase [Rubrivivax sp.]
MGVAGGLLLACTAGLCAAPPAAALDAGVERELEQRVAAIEPQLIAWRHDIHQHPELSGQETRTAALVAAHLRQLGLEVTTGVGGTGVVGLLRGALPGKVVALRADMDALPVTEQTGLPFASQATGNNMGRETGVMHACGHDGHTAILMAVAQVLSGMRPRLHGSVKFIFQPAEEGYSQPPRSPDEPIGALAMIQAGALENPKVEAIYGLHLVSQLPAGVIGYRSGPAMASSDTWELKVIGRQTHGGVPWAGVDPIVVSAQIILGLQTLVSRQANIAAQPVVLSIGSIHGGNRENIIPDSVELLGTLRTYDDGMRDDIVARMRNTAESIAHASGATTQFRLGAHHYGTTINAPDLTARALPVLTRVVHGNIREVPKITAAEDFSEFQKRVPGLFFVLGATAPGKDPATAPSNHSPLFRVDDAALAVGVRALAALALEER